MTPPAKTGEAGWDPTYFIHPYQDNSGFGEASRSYFCPRTFRTDDPNASSYEGLENNPLESWRIMDGQMPIFRKPGVFREEKSKAKDIQEIDKSSVEKKIKKEDKPENESIQVKGTIYTIRYKGGKPVKVTIPFEEYNLRIMLCGPSSSKDKKEYVITVGTDHINLIPNWGGGCGSDRSLGVFSLPPQVTTIEKEQDSIGKLNSIEKRAIETVKVRIQNESSQENIKKLKKVLTALQRVADDGILEKETQSRPTKDSTPDQKASPTSTQIPVWMPPYQRFILRDFLNE